MRVNATVKSTEYSRALLVCNIRSLTCMCMQETVGDQEQELSTRLPLRRRLRCLGPVMSAIFLQAFTLTFVAEWGDRSQITTIILAAREVCSYDVSPIHLY